MASKDKETLRSIYLEVKDNIEKLEKTTGRTWTPPFESDSPCYYCCIEAKEHCDWCIQNPKAKIYDEFREQK